MTISKEPVCCAKRLKQNPIVQKMIEVLVFGLISERNFPNSIISCRILGLIRNRIPGLRTNKATQNGKIYFL